MGEWLAGEEFYERQCTMPALSFKSPCVLSEDFQRCMLYTISREVTIVIIPPYPFSSMPC